MTPRPGPDDRVTVKPGSGELGGSPQPRTPTPAKRRPAVVSVGEIGPRCRGMSRGTKRCLTMGLSTTIDGAAVVKQRCWQALRVILTASGGGSVGSNPAEDSEPATGLRGRLGHTLGALRATARTLHRAACADTPPRRPLAETAPGDMVRYQNERALNQRVRVVGLSSSIADHHVHPDTVWPASNRSVVGRGATTAGLHQPAYPAPMTMATAIEKITWSIPRPGADFVTLFRDNDHRAPVLLQVRVGNFTIVHMGQSSEITKYAR
jgi:hypothetical protein